MTILCSTPTTPIPIPIPIAARMSIPSPSPSPPLESIPMSRSPASMGVSRTPTAIPMTRATTATAPRRVPAPAPPPMRREGVPMGVPMGGVAMERSSASLGTDYNPFYLRQPVVRPARVCVLPLAVSGISVPASVLPSPPPSPVPSRRPTDENALTPLAKRSALTPRAFPAVWPDSPSAHSRRRRRRGLSAPLPHLLVRIPDSAKTAPRTATTPIRACGHTRHASVALALPVPMTGE